MQRLSWHILKEETDFDSPLGTGTGAGVIFGRTGGGHPASVIRFTE